MIPVPLAPAIYAATAPAATVSFYSGKLNKRNSAKGIYKKGDCVKRHLYLLPVALDQGNR
jgi:hypothetical protein